MAAVLDPKNSKIVYKKTAKKSMVDGAPLVDYSSHPVVPNFFGGQYSPFLPIAALGAAITIGDRSSVTLGAMTLAGIVTAMQLNNTESGGKVLGGLKKSWEEQAFDSARDYLLAAVDNIGKLDVQSDGDAGDSDSENDDTNFDIYPRYFAKDVTKKSKAETKATERAITILRAACPEQMHKLAKLSTENKYVAEAIANMEKHNEAWGDLQFGRSELKLLQENPTAEGAFGEDGHESEGTVYMPWKKGVNIAGTELCVASALKSPTWCLCSLPWLTFLSCYCAVLYCVPTEWLMYSRTERTCRNSGRGPMTCGRTAPSTETRVTQTDLVSSDGFD